MIVNDRNNENVIHKREKVQIANFITNNLTEHFQGYRPITDRSRRFFNFETKLKRFLFFFELKKSFKLLITLLKNF